MIPRRWIFPLLAMALIVIIGALLVYLPDTPRILPTLYPTSTFPLTATSIAPVEAKQTLEAVIEGLRHQGDEVIEALSSDEYLYCTSPERSNIIAIAFTLTCSMR